MNRKTLVVELIETNGKSQDPKALISCLNWYMLKYKSDKTNYVQGENISIHVNSSICDRMEENGMSPSPVIPESGGLVLYFRVWNDLVDINYIPLFPLLVTNVIADAYNRRHNNSVIGYK